MDDKLVGHRANKVIDPATMHQYTIQQPSTNTNQYRNQSMRKQPVSSSSSSSSSSSRNNDPVSTPARRRRIIADVAKFLLRQYCTKACINVARLRLETKSSIAIQCMTRCKQAFDAVDRLRFMRRNRAAITIQRSYRGYTARKHAYKLRERQKNVLATILAMHVQAWRRGVTARKRYARMLANHRHWLQRKLNRAAVLIQAAYRGYRSRVRFKEMYKQHQDQLLHRRQLEHRSCLLIQKCMRRKLAYIVYKKRMLLLLARRTIVRFIEKYHTIRRHVRDWKLLKLQLMQMEADRRKLVSAIIIQKCVRRFLSQMLLLRLRKQHQDDLAAAAAAKPPVPSMEVRAMVDLHLLRHMALQGPASVLKWCLHNFILHYNMEHARISVGSVVLQVVGAVENILPSMQQSDDVTTTASDVTAANAIATSDVAASLATNDTIEGDSDSEITRSVMLPKWINENESDLPIDHDFYPQHWSQSIELSGGGQVYVEIHDKAIEVHIMLTKDDNNSAFMYEGASSSSLFHLVLLLEAVDKDNAIERASITPAVTGMPMDVATYCLLRNDSTATGTVNDMTVMQVDDFYHDHDLVKESIKFQFKDVVVFINVQQTIPPPPPLTAAVVVEADEAVILPPSLLLDTVGAIERPVSRARILIQLSVPEEPVVDYDVYACKIQSYCKRWLDRRTAAAVLIQCVLKSHYILGKWKSMLTDVIVLMNESIITIQKYTRRYLASTRVANKRVLVCRQLIHQCNAVMQACIHHEIESGIYKRPARYDQRTDDNSISTGSRYCNYPEQKQNELYRWSSSILALSSHDEAPVGCIALDSIITKQQPINECDDCFDDIDVVYNVNSTTTTVTTTDTGILTPFPIIYKKISMMNK